MTKPGSRKVIHSGLLVMICLGWIIFSTIICLSNAFDWDFFYANIEVERRSWILDHALPLWSNQLCSGISRFADPQAFGLSPLFIFVLIFGSVLGSKIIVLGLALLGWKYTEKTVLLFFELSGEVDSKDLPDEVRLSCTILAASLIWSNFFLWHLYVGHFSFCLFFIALGINFYGIKALFHPLRNREIVVFSLLVLLIFSAGFYQVAIFYLLPVWLALILVFSVVQIRLFLGSKRPWLQKNIVKLCLSGLFGLFLASPKILAVVMFQLEHPRKTDPLTEVGSLEKTLLFQAVPTWFGHFVGKWNLSEPWEVWEYSSFNIGFWLSFVLFIGILLRRPRHSLWRLIFNMPIILIFAIVGVAGLFAIGDSSSYSIYSFMNKYLDNGVRVIGRFQFVFSYACLCAVAFFFGTDWRNLRRLYEPVTWFIVVVCIANMTTFAPYLGAATFLDVLRTPKNLLSKMRVIARAPKHEQQEMMYSVIATGKAISNCYNPGIRIVHYDLDQLPATDFPISFIDDKEGRIDSRCRENSYFTQNQIFLDPSCPQGTCINLSEVNLKRNPEFQFDHRFGRFCLSSRIETSMNTSR